jgi:site-specific DNA recombinase
MLYATLPTNLQGLRTVPVAIYTRVSTDGQTRHRFDSCEHQANVCREYIGKKNASGWFEVGLYSDEAYSGATLERPGIRRLMQCIAAGQVSVLLIYRLERILRSISEWVRFQDFLDEHGCRLLSPTEDHSDTSASGRLRTNVMMSFAEYERSNVGEKTRSKMRAQARQGLWGGGYIPYGYDYDRVRQQLVPNAAEAPTLKQIFELASELVPLREIVTELRKSDIYTSVRWEKGEDGERRRVGGKPFRIDTIRRLIQNPIYRGVIRSGNDEFQGQHAALVDANVWERANAAVAESKRVPRNPLRDRDKNSNLLKGILTCAVCAQPLFSKASGKTSAAEARYRYYVCTAKLTGRDPKRACYLKNVPAEPLEDLVLTFLGCISRQDATVRWINDLPQIMRPRQAQLSGELASVEQELQAIQSKTRNCVEILSDGGMEALRPELVERVAQLTRERQPLLVRHEEIRQKIAALTDQFFDVARVQQAFERLGRVILTMPRAELRALLFIILERIEIRQLESSKWFKVFAPGDRLFRLSFRIRMEALVSEMEQGGAAPAKRSQSGELEAEVVIGRNWRTRIVGPFRIDLDGSTQAAPPLRESAQHPIHRAARWSKAIVGGVGVRTIAREEGVSPSLVSLHGKLVRLDPEIQGFLRDLTSERALRHFSLRKLARLSEFPREKQLEEFVTMRSRFNQAIVTETPCATPSRAAQLLRTF